MSRIFVKLAGTSVEKRQEDQSYSASVILTCPYVLITLNMRPTPT